MATTSYDMIVKQPCPVDGTCEWFFEIRVDIKWEPYYDFTKGRVRIHPADATAFAKALTFHIKKDHPKGWIMDL